MAVQWKERWIKYQEIQILLESYPSKVVRRRDTGEYKDSGMPGFKLLLPPLLGNIWAPCFSPSFTEI